MRGYEVSPMESIGSIRHESILMECHFLFVRYLVKFYPCWLSLQGVESSSDGIYRIHWRHIDSFGNVDVLIVCYLEKFHLCWLNL